ncbi:MAG TPA: hypothetical protein VL134_08685, partial [Leptolyngbya sp.]|nr:hypothetical protein [Leptolyngbya sp.]
MSEAEIPNHSDSVETRSESTPESGWTTVNFPNAIEIHTIPEAEPEPAQVGLRVKDLEQQNQSLRSRVANLEFLLGESHATLKSETKRLETQISTQQAEVDQRSARETHLTQQQAAMIAKQRQALEASRQRLQDQEDQLTQQLQTIATTQAEVVQLSQALDQAHQAQQKQQILIETLTVQLEVSQTQVAQLERDCALTKQQYDEQIQQVRQSETAVRDLRSRLHRQQQYTLQFKAALEKCLDVSVTQKIEESVDHAISASELHSETAEPVKFVKAQPVQPWSTTLNYRSIWDSEPEAVTNSIAVPLESVWATAPDDASLFEEPDEPDLIEAATPIEAVEPDFIEPTDYSDIAPPEPMTVHPPLSYTIARSTAEEPPVHADIHLFAPTANQTNKPADVIDEPIESIESISESISVEEPTIAAEAIPVEAPIEEVTANPFHFALPPAIEP